MGIIGDFIKKKQDFPEEQKKNPLYLMHLKNSVAGHCICTLNPNSPSHLEWWYEDKDEEWEIIESHGFELLLMMESENVTLKDAADKLIGYYKKEVSKLENEEKLTGTCTTCNCKQTVGLVLGQDIIEATFEECGHKFIVDGPSLK